MKIVDAFKQIVDKFPECDSFAVLHLCRKLILTPDDVDHLDPATFAAILKDKDLLIKFHQVTKLNIKDLRDHFSEKGLVFDANVLDRVKLLTLYPDHVGNLLKVWEPVHGKKYAQELMSISDEALSNLLNTQMALYDFTTLYDQNGSPRPNARRLPAVVIKKGSNTSDMLVDDSVSVRTNDVEGTKVDIILPKTINEFLHSILEKQNTSGAKAELRFLIDQRPHDELSLFGSFSDLSLSPDDIRLFADILRSDTTLRKLKLSTSINDEDFAYLASALTENHALETLLLDHMKPTITNDSPKMRALMDAMQTNQIITKLSVVSYFKRDDAHEPYEPFVLRNKALNLLKTLNYNLSPDAKGMSKLHSEARSTVYSISQLLKDQKNEDIKLDESTVVCLEECCRLLVALENMTNVHDLKRDISTLDQAFNHPQTRAIAMRFIEERQNAVNLDPHKAAFEYCNKIIPKDSPLATADGFYAHLKGDTHKIDMLNALSLSNIQVSWQLIQHLHQNSFCSLLNILNNEGMLNQAVFNALEAQYFSLYRTVEQPWRDFFHAHGDGDMVMVGDTSLIKLALEILKKDPNLNKLTKDMGKPSSIEGPLKNPSSVLTTRRAIEAQAIIFIRSINLGHLETESIQAQLTKMAEYKPDLEQIYMEAPDSPDVYLEAYRLLKGLHALSIKDHETAKLCFNQPFKRTEFAWMADNSKYVPIADSIRENRVDNNFSLSGHAIRDGGVKLIADAFKINTTYRVLDLSNNHISDIGARYLADMLEVNTALTSIDLSGNSIGTNGSANIFFALRDKNYTLTELKGLDNDAMTLLVQNQLDRNKMIAELLVFIRSIDPKQLAPRSIQDQMTKITNFDSFIGRRYNTDESNYMVDIYRLLKSLYAISTNDIKEFPQVYRFPFAYQRIEFTDILNAAMANFIKEHQADTTLSFDFCNLENSTIKMIADSLQTNVVFTKLSNTYGDIDATGASYLADMLKTNSTLKSLSLDGVNNKRNNAVAEIIADGLENNYALTELVGFENTTSAARIKGYLDRNKDLETEQIQIPTVIEAISDNTVVQITSANNVSENTSEENRIPLVETVEKSSVDVPEHIDRNRDFEAVSSTTSPSVDQTPKEVLFNEVKAQTDLLRSVTFDSTEEAAREPIINIIAQLDNLTTHSTPKEVCDVSSSVNEVLNSLPNKAKLGETSKGGTQQPKAENTGSRGILRDILIGLLNALNSLYQYMQTQYSRMRTMMFGRQDQEPPAASGLETKSNLSSGNP